MKTSYLTHKNKGSNVLLGPRLMSIITHKDGTHHHINGCRELSTAAIDQKVNDKNHNKHTKYDKNDSPNSDGYRCHFVTRNPTFLASISYPRSSEESGKNSKSHIADQNKEYRAGKNQSSVQEGLQTLREKVGAPINSYPVFIYDIKVVNRVLFDLFKIALCLR